MMTHLPLLNKNFCKKNKLLNTNEQLIRSRHITHAQPSYHLCAAVSVHDVHDVHDVDGFSCSTSLVSDCGFFLFLSTLFGPSACCGSSEKNKCDLKYCPTLSPDYFQ